MKLEDCGSKQEEKPVDSSEKLLRKREAARLRQQRCRARKRAAAAAALESKIETGGSRLESLSCGEGSLPDHCLRDTSPISIKRARPTKMIPTPPTVPSSHLQHQRMSILTTPVNSSDHPGTRTSPPGDTTPLPFHGSAGPLPKTGASQLPYYMHWYHPPLPVPTAPWMMPPPHQPGISGYHVPHPIPPSSSHHHHTAGAPTKETTPPMGSQSHTNIVPPVTVSSTPKSPVQQTFFPFASPLLPTPASNLRPSLGRPSNASSLPTATPIKPSKELEMESSSSDSSDVSI